MTVDEDLQTIERVLAGEQSVYAVLVERYKRYVYTITFRILQNKPEAEEAAQDAFVKAFHHLSGFNRQSKFSTWLYRIAFNTAITYRRKNRHQFQSIESAYSLHPLESESSLERNDKKRYLDMAMSKLNELDRTALSLFYLQEFSLEEIAEIMNMQANTVKVRVHRARQRIADELMILLQKEALTL